MLANLLLVFVGGSCTRWLLLPWLLVHAALVQNHNEDSKNLFEIQNLTLIKVVLLGSLGLLVLFVPVHQDKLTVLLGIDFQVFRLGP